jgi:alanine-glyoxylate transaminase/serine-glyoxylate transaminase/serine-pyruvate transaminase
VQAWGLLIQCADPVLYSPVLTGVITPGRVDADCNDLTLVATLAGVEMGLRLAGVRLAGSGVSAAMEFFAATPLRAPVV